jgi:hypothetical protein
MFKPKSRLLLPKGYNFVNADRFVENLTPKDAISIEYSEFEDTEPIMLSYLDIPNYFTIVEGFNPTYLFLSDEYSIPYEAYDYKTHLLPANIHKLAYQELRRDCDDFALLAYSYVKTQTPLVIPCFGIIWLIHKTLGYAHALNFLVLRTKKGLQPALYEPQTAQLLIPPYAVKWQFWMCII